MASTGTQGPIVDFTGKSAFGTTSPLALAKTQIADQAAAMRIVAVVISVQLAIQGYCHPKFKEF
jgi:hypothetical protein